MSLDVAGCNYWEPAGGKGGFLSDYVFQGGGSVRIEYDFRYGVSFAAGSVVSIAPRLGGTGTASDVLTDEGYGGPDYVPNSSMYNHRAIGDGTGGPTILRGTPGTSVYLPQPNTIVAVCRWGIPTGRVFTGVSFGAENAVYRDPTLNSIIVYGGSFVNTGHNPDTLKACMMIVSFNGANSSFRLRYNDGTIISAGPFNSGTENMRGFTLFNIPSQAEDSQSEISAVLALPSAGAGVISALDTACQELYGWA